MQTDIKVPGFPNVKLYGTWTYIEVPIVSLHRVNTLITPLIIPRKDYVSLNRAHAGNLCSFIVSPAVAY